MVSCSQISTSCGFAPPSVPRASSTSLNVAVTDRPRGTGSPSGFGPERGRTIVDSAVAAVDLYWIPLGAGGHSVRFNGKVYEAIVAAWRHHPRRDLYHAALVVELAGERWTIELAPSPDADEAARGVVGTGAVGSRRLGRFRLFRYELRCWREGSIPDLRWAVGGPQRLTVDSEVARRLLELVPSAPRPVWGRDELRTGDMWNSNSIVAWLLVRAGLPTERLRPPVHGRAPGWDAGLVTALASSASTSALAASTSTPTEGSGRGRALPARRPGG